jgi:hypothetical protein
MDEGGGTSVMVVITREKSAISKHKCPLDRRRREAQNAAKDRNLPVSLLPLLAVRCFAGPAVGARRALQIMLE